MIFNFTVLQEPAGFDFVAKVNKTRAALNVVIRRRILQRYGKKVCLKSSAQKGSWLEYEGINPS